ncbi:glutathione S-transferase [uncultured Roseovarius sp.]|uniref:glutathione S-transferase n=1 Tax=uncultured Roseovarius sp. TaxID=293344 RepID=UPI0026354120|nr:glutathione S-transferase [uncultured Roseovarius sp.]
MALPILWSFRRCPYAMRARLAIASAGARVELREVVLRDKTEAFLGTSLSATVPCLDTGSGVFDESLDVMIAMLRANDPEGWLEKEDQSLSLIEENDGWFKTALDRYKYASRHVDVDSEDERRKAGLFLYHLNQRLAHRDWLCGTAPALADMAILPFVRQFAHVDLVWFNAQPWPHVIRWLEVFKTSDRFAAIMKKYPQWKPGDAPILFP